MAFIVQHTRREICLFFDLSTYLTAEAAILATPIVQLASRARVSDARARTQLCKGASAVVFTGNISTDTACLALWVCAAWICTIVADQRAMRLVVKPMLDQQRRKLVQCR